MPEMNKQTTLDAREHFKVAQALSRGRSTLRNVADFIERMGDPGMAADLRTVSHDLNDAGDIIAQHMSVMGADMPQSVTRGRQTSPALVKTVSDALGGQGAA